MLDKHSLVMLLIILIPTFWIVWIRFAFRSRRKINMEQRDNRIRPITQKDINRGLEKAFKDKRKIKQRSSTPFMKPQPKRQVPQLSIEIPEPEPEPEPEAYWSPQDWEQWAYDIYSHYPEYRKILPDWFIKALNEYYQ